MNTVLLRCLLIVLLIGVVVWGIGFSSAFEKILRPAGTAKNLTVTFLDVGQGDAIFIETAFGRQVMIDGGPDSTVLRELSAVMSPWDRTIDMVIGTHPDKDHIGGVVEVLARYRVTTLLTTENKGDTTVATAYQEALLSETNGAIWYARAGQIIDVGDGVTLAVFSPADNPAMLETNTSSVVLQLRYGDIEFMLTGDAPQGIEDYLVKTYGSELLESEVLKLGHHGSETSTSDLFLKAVTPRFAVASVGKDNSYGHPKPAVVARAIATGAKVLSTAELGRITFETDGVAVWVVE